MPQVKEQDATQPAVKLIELLAQAIPTILTMQACDIWPELRASVVDRPYVGLVAATYSETNVLKVFEQIGGYTTLRCHIDYDSYRRDINGSSILVKVLKEPSGVVFSSV